MADCVFMLGADGTITAAGRHWAPLVSPDAADPTGGPFLDLVAAEHRDDCSRALCMAMDGATAVVEFRAAAGAGELWRATLAPFPGDDGPAGVAAFVRRTTTADAARSRMIGLATRSIGHDLNNLLTIIVGLNGLLTENVDSERASLYTAEIAKAADRAALLADELMALGRKPESVTLISVNGLLTELRQLIGRLAGTAALETELDPAVPPVMAERPAFISLIVELMACATAVVGPEGRICLETRVPPTVASASDNADGDDVAIACILRLTVHGAERVPDETMLDAMRHSAAACHGTIEIQMPAGELDVAIMLPRAERWPGPTTP